MVGLLNLIPMKLLFLLMVQTGVIKLILKRHALHLMMQKSCLII